MTDFFVMYGALNALDFSISVDHTGRTYAKLLDGGGFSI
jgi:hypothetical protein